jgi:hypothetical protein
MTREALEGHIVIALLPFKPRSGKQAPCPFRVKLRSRGRATGKSALPSITDIVRQARQVRKVPEPEVACVWIALYAAFLFFVFRRTYSCQTMSRQNPKLFHPTFS